MDTFQRLEAGHGQICCSPSARPTIQPHILPQHASWHSGVWVYTPSGNIGLCWQPGSCTKGVQYEVVACTYSCSSAAGTWEAALLLLRSKVQNTARA